MMGSPKLTPKRYIKDFRSQGGRVWFVDAVSKENAEKVRIKAKCLRLRRLGTNSKIEA